MKKGPADEGGSLECVYKSDSREHTFSSDCKSSTPKYPRRLPPEILSAVARSATRRRRVTLPRIRCLEVSGGGA
jgi:hypothetical protein